MDYIIEAKNLSKSYGNLKAVNDISFKVKRGNLFAFLGLNGAGKSTTINILCSIIKKDLGDVFIDNLNIDSDNRLVKEKIGIVFQNSVLDEQLTVYQNLKSRASLYNLKKNEIIERINNLIKILELDDIKDRQYGNLSGGQKRKVDIARALIHNPKILFLDEPTTGLDPNTRNTVWNILHNLMDENGLTIFLTTHYMEEVLRANHVVILDGGVIAAEGSPDYLKDLYASDLLRIISKKNNEIESLLNKNKITFNFSKESYQINIKNSLEAFEIINLNPNLLSNFEVLKGNMDQVFLNVTGKKLVKTHD